MNDGSKFNTLMVTTLSFIYVEWLLATTLDCE